MGFGPIKTAWTVEQAAQAILALWLPYWLGEAERQAGRQPSDPWIPGPRSIEVFTRLSRWEEHQLPAVVVVSDGTDGAPSRDGRGRWSAWWRLGVGVWVSARDQDATRRVGHLYAAAIRGCLLSHPTLGGVADRIDWTGERQDEVETDQARTMAAATVSFRVHMTDVAGVGPTVMPTPTPDPHLPWPADPNVQTTNINITGEAP